MDREFRCCAGRIGRRAALELGICLALAPCLALAQTDAARERPREGDLLVAVGATPSEPLKPDDLPLDGKQTFAWPMDPTTSTLRNGSRLNKVLVLRLDPEGFDPETKGRTIDGVVASRPYVRIRAATSPIGTLTSCCSSARAITRCTIRRKGQRWSAGRRRAACRRCR